MPPDYHTRSVGFKLPLFIAETQAGKAVNDRGGVEDTTFEAKAKDSKKIRGQGPTFRGQTLLRPRRGMVMVEAKDRGHNFSKYARRIFHNF